MRVGSSRHSCPERYRAGTNACRVGFDGGRYWGLLAICIEEGPVTTAAASMPSGPPPDVRAPGGTIRGTWEAGVAVFRGIRFAEPPVGELRLAAPRSVRSWDGIREAVSYGPPPPQATAFGMDRMASEATGDDWLTLNVWAPEPRPGAGLPTMVWLHGG